jgi:type IV pilus assembly protein PilF
MKQLRGDRRWFRAFAALCCAWALGAPLAPQEVQAGLGPAPTAQGSDLRTPSDQGQAERRARVRLELASAYFAKGQIATALDELKQALSHYPELAEGWNLRGLIYASLRDFDRAQSSFERALALAPQDGAILHNQGWFLCQRGQYNQAQVAFAQALQQPLYTEHAKTRLAQGVCLARAGREDDAIALLRLAFERDPGQPALAVNLAQLLVHQGRFVQAAAYIRSVNQQPAWLNAQTLWLGAQVEQGLGDGRAADELLQQLRRQFPQAPESWAAQRGVTHD